MSTVLKFQNGFFIHTTMLKKGDKKLINAWAFYDWANSAYSLVIATAVFPIYYSSLTESFASVDGKINFLGTHWNATTLYDYTLALSFLLVAFMSPILSGIADYTGNKKIFMRVFNYIGAFSCIGLYFFNLENISALDFCALLLDICNTKKVSSKKNDFLND